MHKLEFIVAQELSEITSHRQQPKPSQEGLKALTAGTPAAIVDHTLLNAAALPTEVVALTEAAIKFGCATVCVNSSYIPLVRDTLRAAGVGADAHPRPIAVVGFPLGAGTPKSKAFEARQAIDDGAAEIDMVMNVGRLKAKEYSFVHEDISTVVRECESEYIPVKVILETCLLTPEEIIAASVIAREAGAAFIKTSTGFSTGGATVEGVTLMRAVAAKRPGMKVKASGGIGTLTDVRRMVEAGADRIGASRTAQIVADAAAGTTQAAVPSSTGQY